MQHKSVVLLNILYYVYDLVAFEKSFHQVEMRCPKSQYMTKAICSNKTCCCGLIKNRRNLYEFPPPLHIFLCFPQSFRFSVQFFRFFRFSKQFFSGFRAIFSFFFVFWDFFGFSVFSAEKKFFFRFSTEKKISEKMETLSRTLPLTS